jgi:hypothetical protein
MKRIDTRIRDTESILAFLERYKIKKCPKKECDATKNSLFICDHYHSFKDRRRHPWKKDKNGYLYKEEYSKVAKMRGQSFREDFYQCQNLYEKDFHPLNYKRTECGEAPEDCEAHQTGNCPFYHD